MRKFAELMACLLFLSSCRLLSYDDLNPAIQPNSHLLPILEIKPDYRSIRAVYNVRKDIRIADAVNIFSKEVRENIMEQTGKTKGTITMRINYGETKRNKLYAASKKLMFIPTILGMPFDNAEQVLEIEVLVQNKQNDIIKRYVERVENEEYAALYWGYNKEDVQRKVAAENMKNAMAKIRQKINDEAPQIRAKLE
ncbi:MAG: hypothetical protein IJ218_00290 [Alphaproteobacteria bacterium]|nr:hypothetical protein [Alphaproteobacteria bacterium]